MLFHAGVITADVSTTSKQLYFEFTKVTDATTYTCMHNDLARYLLSPFIVWDCSPEIKAICEGKLSADAVGGRLTKEIKDFVGKIMGSKFFSMKHGEFKEACKMSRK